MEKNIAASPWENDYKSNQMSPVYEPLWQMLELFLNEISPKKVLDYGCGDGNYAFLMGKRGVNVVGIDIASNAIEKAKIFKEKYQDEHCSFICDDSIPEDLPSDSFDAVILLNAYHCLNHKERALIMNQIKGVLKKNGYLFLSVLSLEDESYPRGDWNEIEENTFDDGNGRVFHFFSWNELVNELEGFEILDKEMLENIHPEVGRKSSLFVLTVKKI